MNQINHLIFRSPLRIVIGDLTADTSIALDVTHHGAANTDVTAGGEAEHSSMVNRGWLAGLKNCSNTIYPVT